MNGAPLRGPPIESQTRAGLPTSVAASAARPPPRGSLTHRGRRSCIALQRRRSLWLHRRPVDGSERRTSVAESIASVNRRDGFVFRDATLPNSNPKGLTDLNPHTIFPEGASHDVLSSSSAGPEMRETHLKGSDACSFTFLHANVQGLISKSAEVSFMVEACGFPSIVCFTETFLDKSKAFMLPGYIEIARLDRRTGERQGGIIMFAKVGFETAIVHVGDSSIHERSWFVIHSDEGPILLALWYRRPAHNEIASIESLYEEVSEFGEHTMRTIIVGDMNVHEASWLRYSDGTSAEGQALRTFAQVSGLEEHVGQPTRGENLLDLVLSDMSSSLSCAVHTGVSDHCAVVGTIRFSVPESHIVVRELFDYKRAPWGLIHGEFSGIAWEDDMDGLDTDDAASFFTERVLQVLRKHVRNRRANIRISSHPWLNDRCRDAIAAKHAAKGSSEEIQRRDACSGVLSEEHSKYIERTRATLSNLSSSARSWWKLSNALQGRGKNSHGIQSLRRPDKSWARHAQEKVDLLAETFLNKSKLPGAVTNEYTDLQGWLHVADADDQADGFLAVRTKDVERHMRKLDGNSATGPDGVAATVLQKCSRSLARPLALVVRKMLIHGRWPRCWRNHYIVPLYKKKAKSDPNNYRGVHLTSQISKVAERIVGHLFLPKLQAAGMFGMKQFAYSAKRSHQDALALSVLTWLIHLERGCMVALYCSDVSGAFDRVCEQRLGTKLDRSGLHPRILRFLKSWLEPRTSSVILDGYSSTLTPLENSVYQGTVLGPPLWNVHYADAKRAVNNEGFEEVVFADDLNCSMAIGPGISEAHAREELRRCQVALHRWGAANRVLFDPAKESFHGLHRTRHFGEPFKILGVLFDCQLTMHAAVEEIAKESSWKLRALLRCRKYYSQKELVKLYKAQILSYIESRTSGLHHAAPSVLDGIDRVQRRFLHEIGLSEIQALLWYKLAPLPARRDISMLGLLHRVSHGLAAEPLANLFVHHHARHHTQTRGVAARHNRQMVEYMDSGGHTEVIRRSCFGLVTVWNMLPVAAAEAKTTSACQRQLQHCLIQHAQLHPNAHWPHFFQQAARVMPVHAFQRLFR